MIGCTMLIRLAALALRTARAASTLSFQRGLPSLIPLALVPQAHADEALKGRVSLTDLRENARCPVS
jgi:hypothetical protein